MNAQGHELAPQGTLGSLGTGNEKLAIASIHSGDPVREARSPCNPLTGEARAIWDSRDADRVLQPVVTFVTGCYYVWAVVVPFTLRLLEEP
jgi:hypothetical protein